MKKLVTLLCCIAILFAFTGCFDTDTPQLTATPESTDPTPSIMIAATPTAKPQEVTLKILGTTIGKDYKDAPILIVEYEFTNNSDKANSFTFMVTDKAFQNGVECGDIVISDEIDSQKQLNDIKPGVVYKLKVGYALQDTDAPVEIEITDLYSDEEYLKQTINLK